MRYLKEKEKQGEDLMRKIGERLEISSRFRKILRALAVAAVILTITAGCADYIGAWRTGGSENNAGSIAKNTEDNTHNITRSSTRGGEPSTRNSVLKKARIPMKLSL